MSVETPLSRERLHEAPARFRFAPSPTGPLHLGNARTALFSYLWARRLGGRFLLRIEDTDRERSDPGAETALLEDLHWLGIDWDEGPGREGAHGPYRQSERRALYARALEDLVGRGLAYPCFCSAEDLARRREERLRRGLPPRYDGRCRDLSAEEVRARRARGEAPVWRFRLEGADPVAFTDLVYGPHAVARETLDDFVLVRADGSPTFLFANALDDALMEVTHVVRGVDHLDNTPRQILLFAAWGRPAPAYAHLPLVVGLDDAPLAKRAGTGSLGAFRARGLRPEALRAYLLHLGHAPHREEGLLGESPSGLFDPARLGRAPARFDEAQLRLWQERALAALDPERYRLWLAQVLGRDAKDPLLAERAEVLRTVVAWVEDARAWWAILDDPPLPSPGAVPEDDLRAVLTAALGIDPALDVRAFAKALSEHTGRRGRALYLPLRLALTGRTEGPELATLWSVVPPERRRLLFARVLRWLAHA
jgi:nondiscriminating glutamyl-tRNA synthetase